LDTLEVAVVEQVVTFLLDLLVLVDPLVMVVELVELQVNLEIMEQTIVVAVVEQVVLTQGKLVLLVDLV
jgi:hypothetical protein|tara:strand:- start:11 stop:217 length:207 start_codon:yes stop_codon:yes gene_type:complete